MESKAILDEVVVVELGGAVLDGMKFIDLASFLGFESYCIRVYGSYGRPISITVLRFIEICFPSLKYIL